ncbi:hypothetical protein [Nannocystis exedens]|uniref:hypothetical protein n=1 Tax=Nannocystis exedens TaxID=54 RepID=UPI00117DD2C7|nr:hypothetical protein [Nannocystis exedens]
MGSALALLALAACPAAPEAGQPDTATTTEALWTTTGSGPDAPDSTGSSAATDATASDPTMPGDHPCAACVPGEFCRWVGSDDLCHNFPQYACEPLPAGCAFDELESLACVHAICGVYAGGFGDPCDFGSAFQCPGRHDCDPWDPHPCGTEGAACLPVSNDDDLAAELWACVPAPAPGVPVGEPCTLVSDGRWSWGDCEDGALCSRIDPDTQQGICTPRCAGTPDEPVCGDPATTCVAWAAGDSEIHLCEPTCDPLAGPGACPMGQVCVGRVPHCAPDVSGDLGAYGDTCEWTNDCDPGLLCATAEFIPACDPADYTCCTPYCDLTQPTCPPDLSCVPAYETGEAPPGHDDLGLCALPP